VATASYTTPRDTIDGGSHRAFPVRRFEGRSKRRRDGARRRAFEAAAPQRILRTQIVAAVAGGPMRAGRRAG
jgi:hypothetical protein